MKLNYFQTSIRLIVLSTICQLFLIISNSSLAQDVTIGNQIWMTKNLNITTFRNGDVIPEAKTKQEWENAGSNGKPAYCYYNFDPQSGEEFGKLYNWFAVNDPRGIAPIGYHVASKEEFEIMISTLKGKFEGDDYDKTQSACKSLCSEPIFETKISYVDVGGYYDKKWVECSNCKSWNNEYRRKVACHVCKDERGKYIQGKYIPKSKKKIEEKKEIGGWCGINSSGFKALPGRNISIDGYFNDNLFQCDFWTSSEAPEGTWYYGTFKRSWLMSLGCNSYSIQTMNVEYGYSVRCIKD
jgi:uncharacterized protein (TIGR02145 family)